MTSIEIEGDGKSRIVIIANLNTSVTLKSSFENESMYYLIEKAKDLISFLQKADNGKIDKT